MNSKLLYQLRVDLEQNAAQELINTKNINSCKNLGNIIKEENGELVCQFLAFSKFVEECEQDNLTDSPLYKWTKDTIENKVKKEKYMKSFTIYIKNQQLYEKEVADRIENKIINLGCRCILKVNKYNSDPKNNPQPPKKYFK
ncbi:MAG: hypothetical protein VXW97_01610 [Pseudomonadota bacterium]|nr:hypothetical protein [Pseudomonadota bacterium]